MDTRRLILFFIFSFSLLLIWEAWQKETRPKEAVATAQTTAPAPAPSGQPAKSQTPVPGAVSPAATPGVPPPVASPGQGERIRVETDNFIAEIDTLGADLVFLELRKHRDTLDKSKDFVFLGPEHKYFAQGGLIGAELPNHKTLFSARSKAVRLEDGKDELELRLDATGPDGVKVSKVFTFRRGSYLIDVAFEVTNTTQSPLSAHAYFQITRDNKDPAGTSSMMSTYTGPAIYTEQDKFHKVAFGDVDKGKTPYSKNADNGWIAMLQHYFVAAIVPADKTPREYFTRKLADGYYAAGVIVPVEPIAAGKTAKISVPLYAGPQEQDKLKAISSGLDLVVDYGWLTIIAAPLFWVLELFHGWLGNWGLAIILLTVVLKLIFFPLSAASYRSMAKMKLVAPRLTKLRETYGNDRVKLNQAMMDLYKTEKINPLGGCLPIVVQIPVFIALYWVLLAAVELRQAPFYGWIVDLSAADPWYVLPALMMISMVIQTKLNPTPPDPVQAKVMMIMPFAFGVMFFFFPAGLVLYWLVNNVLSILQQWQITRMIEGTKVAAKR